MRLLDDQDSPELAYRYAQEITSLTPKPCRSRAIPKSSPVAAGAERFEEAKAAYATLEDVLAFRFSAPGQPWHSRSGTLR